METIGTETEGSKLKSSLRDAPRYDILIRIQYYLCSILSKNAYTGSNYEEKNIKWETLYFVKKKKKTSLLVQWLRLYAPDTGGMGWSLVRELRCHMPQDATKKKKKKLKDSQITNAGKVMEKREPSNTVDGNVNWYSQCGK